MPDKEHTSLPFESENPAERKLWEALGELPRGTPSSELRRKFYSSLHEAARPSWARRLGEWLGVHANRGWITAAACLLLGFGFAQVIDEPVAESPRLVALEDSMAELRTELILDRLRDASASTRLRGVVNATEVAGYDQEVTRALLDRAGRDRSLSVRSAAIEALSSKLDTSEVSEGLMRLLENAESPIVQLSLVDLFLRHGDEAQVRALQDLADSGRLHPDLVRHVRTSTGSQPI